MRLNQYEALVQEAPSYNYFDEWLIKWVELAVKSAEQTVLGSETGPEKKAIVTEFIKNLLIKKNITISDEQLNTLIESAVFEMNGGK